MDDINVKGLGTPMIFTFSVNIKFLRNFFAVLLSLFLFSSCTENNKRSDVYIKTEDDLASFANSLRSGEFVDDNGEPVYKVIHLVDDIEITKPFVQIGDMEHPFFGYFDGAEHTIKNLSLKSDTSTSVAMFGYAMNSHIQNFKLENVDMKGDSDVAGICGYAYGTLFMNCEVSGKVEGINCVGGLVGEVSYCTVDNCTFEGSVSGTGYSVGGVAGSFEYGAVIRCNSSGSVSGDVDVSGLVGSVAECLLIENESQVDVKYNRLTVTDFDKISKLLFSSL